jgi:hypothetical protein
MILLSRSYWSPVFVVELWSDSFYFGNLENRTGEFRAHFGHIGY